jgi:PAS domain S-box-containing protein
MAVWAAHWNPEPGPRQAARGRQKTFSELLLSNSTYALAPLIVLLQVSQLGVGWRFVRFFLLGVSILCFAVRLALSESRGSKNEENVRRHAQAMDSSVDGMAILDAKGIYTYVNSAYARMMGEASPESIVGKRWEEITAPEDAARVAPEIRQVLLEKGKWFGPVTIHLREGGTFSMEMAVTLLPDYGTVCVSRDVTERRAAEKALIEAEAKYRTLIEEVAAISYIAELGAKGQWLYVSPQVEQILGYSPDEWLSDSREWMRYIPAEDHSIVLAAEENSKRGERFQAEYRLTRKDGKVIWVSDTAVVVAGSDRHPVMEGIMVDITDRKILENQLQQSRKMEAVGRLAGGIAHDFNNLLTVINGYTELALQRSEKLPELHTHIERIGDASERAARLVRQLLAFSRRQVLQPKVLDLNEIVLGLDKLLRRLMDDNVEMSTVVREKIGAIKADPSQIEQVVMNLVVNARDAMPQGGRLTIETGEVDLDDAYARDHSAVAPGRYVMLAVSDTGMGMDSETQAHIFEPFYTTKSGGKGSGLGLSTVYGIVKQSGGYIWVYSEPGEGTTFKVYLPRVNESPERIMKGRGPLPELEGTETILLVEDEPDVRELAKTILAARGYAVIEAPNPEQAKKLAETFGQDIHLLLTDVVMPGMSGRELAKHVTQNHPKMRVLYMSGYTFNVIAHGGQLEQGLAFLQKPFTPATLVRKIREVLDGHFPEK